MLASKNGFVGVVQLLLAHGADLEAQAERKGDDPEDRVSVFEERVLCCDVF